MKLDLIESLTDKETGLSERETYLLEILFEKASGDLRYAMDLAGYKKTDSMVEVRRKLSKEIKKATKDFLVSETPRAAMSLIKLLQDPNQIGAANLVKAAKEILDRGDVNKEETKFELPENFIILLPPKKFEPEDGIIIEHDET